MSRGIDKAIVAAGSETALAEMLGVSQQAVSKWKKRGFVPIKPVDRASQINNATGVERRELIDPALLEAVDG
jgi:DNA-binding transcriptional regulator YdaS (Cro superfamily)